MHQINSIKIKFDQLFHNIVGHFWENITWNEKKQSNMQSIFLLASVGAKYFFLLNMHLEKTRLLRLTQQTMNQDLNHL